MAVELIRIAEYARRRNVSAQAVHRAVHAGRITLINGRIDPAVADVQWEANTRKYAGSGHTKSTQPKHVFEAHSAPIEAADAPPFLFSYDVSRAKREHHEAILSEARAKREIGQLVETQKVRAAVAAIAGLIGDHLDRLPDRISGEVTPTMTQADIYARVEMQIDALRAELLTAVSDLPDALNIPREETP